METRPSYKMALTERKPNSSEPLRPILGQRLKPPGGNSSSSNTRRALSFLGTNNRRANLRLAESLLTISASEFRDKWNFDPIAETPLPQGQFLWTPVKPTSKVPLVAVKLAAAARPKTEAESDLAACFKLPQKDEVVNTRLNGENNSSCKVSETQTVECITQPMMGQTVSETTQTVECITQPMMGQTCKELRCLSVQETSCSEINKSGCTDMNKQLCSDGENNNTVVSLTSTSTNQRQPVITEFLRASKRPLSSTSCEGAPTGTSEGSIAGTTPPPSKLRRIMSDGDTTS